MNRKTEPTLKSKSTTPKPEIKTNVTVGETKGSVPKMQNPPPPPPKKK